jgi:hypothetical protein
MTQTIPTSAELSVAATLEICIEDARALLLDAKRRGRINDKTSSHFDKVAAAREIFQEMPLYDRMTIRNKRRQEVHDGASASASAAASVVQKNHKSSKKQQTARSGVDSGAVAAAGTGLYAALETLQCACQCLYILVLPFELFAR